MTIMLRRARTIALALVVTSALACDSEQAPRVTLPIVVDSGGIVEFDNDLGYRIQITTLRVAFDNVEFTTGGEMHASVLRRLHDLVIPSAYAHPGHAAGGEVTGEMQGRFVVDWLDDGASLGEAVLLGGTYAGANFVFTRAAAEDGLEDGDPILGHTIEIGGTATKDGTTYTFHGFVDEEDGKRVIGLPISEDVSEDETEFEVDASTDVTLGLQVLMIDPFEPETALDGIDFAAADADGDHDIDLVPGEAPYNLVLRQLQVHDQYRVSIR